MILHTNTLTTPVGNMHLAFHDDGLCAMEFVEAWDRRLGQLRRKYGNVSLHEQHVPWNLQTRVDRYFDRDVAAFDGVPLDQCGTTFQKKVWAVLCRIPFGKTVSYGQLATAIGQPRAARAVGAAAGANLIALIIPCHRAVGRSGKLVNYASGVERKARLLTHEQSIGQPRQKADVA